MGVFGTLLWVLRHPLESPKERKIRELEATLKRIRARAAAGAGPKKKGQAPKNLPVGKSTP